MSGVRRVLIVLVVLALALWLALGRGGDEGEPVLELGRDVNECLANLRQIHAGFLRCAHDPANQARPADERLPQRAGVAVLGALVAGGYLSADERARLTCPGPGAERVEPGVDYRAVDALTNADSGYALRDLVAFPLPRFPAGGSANEALAACDNANGLNHAGCMNVLYTDGSVRTFTLAQEIERGTLPPGARTIPVGPDSPLPDLRVLSPD